MRLGDWARPGDVARGSSVWLPTNRRLKQDMLRGRLRLEKAAPRFELGLNRRKPHKHWGLVEENQQLTYQQRQSGSVFRTGRQDPGR